MNSQRSGNPKEPGNCTKWTAEEPTAIREFSKIKQTAKKTGTTVNDVLLAFYTHALTKHVTFQRNLLTITCMVDNRRYIKETEATGLTNHVGLSAGQDGSLQLNRWRNRSRNCKSHCS